MKNTLNTILLNLGFLAFGALAPLSQAVSPPPDGGYPRGNTAEGQSALLSETTGFYNTAVGIFSLLSLTDGSFNTGMGAGTLLLNTGNSNTATGAGALLSNSTGVGNTADGTFALFSNTTAGDNTAIGFQALLSNSTGSSNTAVGAFALNSNAGETASSNTAIGSNALSSNTTGSNNTAVGDSALAANTTGGLHTAVGFHALANNIADGQGVNTAVGADALAGNTTGGENTAVGHFAMPFSNTGSLNTALGFGAGAGIATASNVTCIGPVSGVSTVAGEVSDACYIAHIHDQPVDSGTAQFVFVDEDGKLGTTNFSSQRFKKEIRPMGETSEAVLALKPVTFQYKNGKKGAPQFGLIAEEVVKVNPDLVVHDKNDQVVAVRYDAVNAMLLNEFLKEHKKVEQLEGNFQAMVAQQQKEIQALTAQLKEQAVQIQRVSAHVEVNRPAPQIVRNNP